MKINSAQRVGDQQKFAPLRLTVWDNWMNAPVVCLGVNSASLYDGTVKAACEGYHELAEKDWRRLPVLAYIDNPNRDLPGTGTLFPSVRRKSDVEDFRGCIQ